MSECILIGATKHMDKLYDQLYYSFQPLAEEGLQINVDMEENQPGKFTFLSCNVINKSHYRKKDGSVKTLCRDSVAGSICEFIINYWEKIILENIIRENYYYFTPEERELIFLNALEYISAKDNLQTLNRKNKILSELNKFLEYNNYIVIDGFIRFRLKDYVEELSEVADKVADDFIMEREYEEFVQLLKYFVDIQEPRLDSVNILLNSSREYELYNSRGESIDSKYLDDLIVEIMMNDVNHEDVLISSLVAISPQEIIFHFTPTENDNNVIDIVEKVFEGRVKYCSGCSLCEKEEERE